MLVDFSRKLNLCRVIFLLFNIIFTTTLALDLYSDNWGVTQFNAKITSYLWTINNCSLSDGQCFKSTEFSRNENDEYKWQLEFCPHGSRGRDGYFVAIFMKLISGPKLEARWRFTVLDGNGRKAIVLSDRATFEAGSNENIVKDMAISLDDLNDKLKNLLPNDSLTILAEIIVNDGTSNTAGERCVTVEEDFNTDRMKKMFEDGPFSDVQLDVGDKTFKVHRAILAAHSPWFLEQFKSYPHHSYWGVKYTSVITSNGLAMQEVLRYIYTGKVENLDLVAKDLLEAADKLGITQLKSVVEAALCKTLNSKNAVEALIAAESLGAPDLKRQASNYILAHAKEIVDSENYKNYTASHPHPALELFSALINRNGA